MSFPVTTRGPQTAADWTAANPILDQFEVGIEINPATGAYERAKLGDGRTAWADLAYWNPSGGPKVYRALLTQTGTDAPVATVIENTLGGEVVWTRGNLGTYAGTLANAFTADKTFVNIQGDLAVGDWDGGTAIKAFSIVRSGSSAVSVQTVIGALGGSWASADDCLVGQSVEILVYP